MRYIEHIRNVVEVQAFGVCNWLGEKLSLPKNHIRLFFIYATCVTTWSPIIIYLILAFWINLKRYLQDAKNEVWE